MVKNFPSLFFLSLLITSSFSPSPVFSFAACNHPVLMQAPLHGSKPSKHPMTFMTNPNLNSYGTFDFVSGEVDLTSTTHHSLVSLLRIFHGILNTVSWGILLPIGTIVAHNFQYEQFEPAWFYIHVYFQVFGSLGGIAGWVSGYILGSKSDGIEYKRHKCIGTTLLILVVLQLLVAAVLRPKRDSKYRRVWSLFHHVVGYTIVILGVVNIFKGFGILDDMGAPKCMRLTYVIILGFEIVVGGLAAAFTYWYKNGNTITQKELEPMGNETV